MASDIQPRPAVMAFARLMEAKLRENDRKGGWGHCETKYLRRRLQTEVAELLAISNARMSESTRRSPAP